MLEKWNDLVDFAADHERIAFAHIDKSVKTDFNVCAVPKVYGLKTTNDDSEVDQKFMSWSVNAMHKWLKKEYY